MCRGLKSLNPTPPHPLPQACDFGPWTPEFAACLFPALRGLAWHMSLSISLRSVPLSAPALMGRGQRNGMGGGRGAAPHPTLMVYFNI